MDIATLLGYGAFVLLMAVHVGFFLYFRNLRRLKRLRKEARKEAKKAAVTS